MQIVAENVWEQLSSCRYWGFWLSRRMTVVRLEGDALWVHSPNALDTELQAELDDLGEVRFVVAPNTHHHTHLEDYLLAYPQAKLYGAPGLRSKRSDLEFHETLGEGTDFPWSTEIDAQLVAGMPELNESVFFHRGTGTLLVADLLFCFGPQDPWPTRLMARVDGTYGRPSVSRDLRRKLINDPSAFARSLERVCSWPVERLLMAHAQTVVSIGAEGIRSAMIP
jgi:hypothetical protein